MRLLLVVSRYPWPPDRGDKVRSVQFLELLSGHHEVTLLAPERPEGAPAPPETGSFQLETYRTTPWSHFRGLGRSLRRGLPWQSGLFYQPHLGERLRQLAPRADLVILQLVRLVPHLQDLEDRPFAVDLVDSLALNFRRRAELEPPGRRGLFRHEARRLERGEADLLAQARRGWVVSWRDRQAMASSLKPEELARLDVLPLAFPLIPGSLLEEPAARGSGGDPRIVLTGNLGYFPNVDGFSWWLQEVWPGLMEERPDLQVTVAGARPAAQLRRAVERAGPRVELVEEPPDLKAVLKSGTLAVAPLRCGSGQPLKILEAWECGVPVVASPWAAAGVAPGSGDALRIAGGTAEEWRQALLHLLDDSEARETLVSRGREHLSRDYSRERLRSFLLEGVRSAVS